MACAPVQNREPDLPAGEHWLATSLHLKPAAEMRCAAGPDKNLPILAEVDVQ